MVRAEDLDFWIRHGYNVLFIGAHGVGKTSIVREAFNRNGLNWKYFSAATMDPWVDLVGVPRERQSPGGEPYLDLLRCQGLDDVEALFFDELNRCLVGSTQIRLVDGRSVAVESLVGESHFYVYSFDRETQSIVVGRGHSARRTGVQQQIYLVALDPGQPVRCTGNHPFLLRTGEYRPASDLKTGDSLMALADTGGDEHVISNRQVVSVLADGLEDVYDISVDKYFNFALGAGIFVHNSHKKVRNAVMELIQFRTINGKPFKNLRAIWAAVNPDDDDTYDVDKLDPAQADRFHIKVMVPYEPETDYFTARYGAPKARAAISWWNEMPRELQAQVSPRRLDYALDILAKDGNIHYVLPGQCNISKLLATLKYGPIQDALQQLQCQKDVAAATAFLANENNYQAAVGYIKKTEKMMEFFLPLLPAEKLAALASEEKPRQYILKSISEHPLYQTCISNIYRAGTDKVAIRAIARAAQESIDVASALGIKGSVGTYSLGAKVETPYFAANPAPGNYRERIKQLASCSSDRFSVTQTTAHRRQWYNEMVSMIPKDLTVEDAVETLGFLNGLAIRCQSATLVGFKHLMGIVNHCFQTIHAVSGHSLERIVKIYEFRIATLWGVIRSNHILSAKVRILYAKSNV